MYYPKNHYILILKNSYTKKVKSYDVTNISTDKLFYKFNFEFSEDDPTGEYEFVLLWCALEYSIKFSSNLLDSVITVITHDTLEEKSFKLRDLKIETGIIKYGEDDEETELSIDQKQNYYSLDE